MKLLILVIQFKKRDVTQKLMKMERQYLIMIKYIITFEFDKLTSENFAAKLKANKTSN